MHSRATTAAVALALFLLTAHATLVCLHGSDSLQMASSSSETSWFCNNNDGCFVDWSFEFDIDVDQSQHRWPIDIKLSLNQTSITALFPEIQSVDLQCSTSGDIVATTEHGPNNERFRLIWSYDYTSAYGCQDLFPRLNFSRDFTNYQSLLSFGGSIFFDGALSTQDADKSIDALSVDCVGTAVTSTPTPSSVPSGTVVEPACTGVKCTRSASYWRSHLNSTAWDSLDGEEICNVPLLDILHKRNDAANLPSSLFELAKLHTTVRLSCLAFACEAPPLEGGNEVDALNAFNEAQAVFDNQTNCVTNITHNGLIVTLKDWIQRKGECRKSTSMDPYMIWAIAVSTVLGVLLIVLCIACIASLPALMSYQRQSSSSSSMIAITSNIDDDDDDTKPIACDRPKKEKKPKKKKSRRNTSDPQSTASPISDTEMDSVNMEL